MTNRTKGILCILASALGFSFMNLLVPLAGQIPTLQKTFFRNIVALGFSVLFLAIESVRSNKQENKTYQKFPWKLMLLRVSLGTGGLLCNFYALDQLLISDASILNKLAPFATLVFSAVFLKEQISRQDILSLGLAFIGVLFVTKPSLDSPHLLPYLFGIAGGMMAGGAYTCVRQLNKLGVPGHWTIFSFSGFSSLVCLVGLGFHFQPMTLTSLLTLLGAGLGASLGQFGITYAYKFAPASEISIFDYSAIIFTGILGYLFLQQVPDQYSLLGYGIIFLATFISYQYKRSSIKKHQLVNIK